MTQIVTLATLAVLAATLVADIVLVLRAGDGAGGRDGADLLSGWVRIATAGGLLLVLALRSLRIGFPAMFSQYDSLVLFAAILLLVVGTGQLRRRRPGAGHSDDAARAAGDAHPDAHPDARPDAHPPDTSPAVYAADVTHARGVTLGSTLVAVVLVGIASSPLVSTEAGPVMPALRSIWLPLHIALAFVGEAFFTVAFVGSAVWLLRGHSPPLDRLVYRSIAVGYGLFTIGGLIFGAIWAQIAWGRYWAWDHKETWALVTWIVYSIYLHARLRRWGQGRVAHIISVVGYLTAMFTLFGVNILYRSLHAY